MPIEISFELFREFCRCCVAGHCMFVNKRCIESNCPVWLQEAKIRAQEAEDEIDNSTQQANYEICPKCGGSGRVYMCAEDGDGIKCHKCSGSGKLS